MFSTRQSASSVRRPDYKMHATQSSRTMLFLLSEVRHETNGSDMMYSLVHSRPSLLESLKRARSSLLHWKACNDSGGTSSWSKSKLRELTLVQIVEVGGYALLDPPSF